MRRMYNRRNSGLIMTDYLLSLFIVAVMCPLMVASIALISNRKTDVQSVQDEIAIAQLQRILIISQEYEIQGSELSFVHQNRTMYLRKVNGNLIIQPGTQIILVDVDDVTFNEEDSLITCTYWRDGKEYERVLVPE